MDEIRSQILLGFKFVINGAHMLQKVFIEKAAFNNLGQANKITTFNRSRFNGSHSLL